MKKTFLTTIICLFASCALYSVEQTNENPQGKDLQVLGEESNDKISEKEASENEQPTKSENDCNGN